MCVACPPTWSAATSKSNYVSAVSPEEFRIIPSSPAKNLQVYAVYAVYPYPRTLGRHIYRTLTSDGYRAPIVYSLGLYMHQTLMTANDRRRRDGGPVLDQPSQWWSLGLTTVCAGHALSWLLHFNLLFWYSQNNLVSRVYNDIFQQFLSPLQLLVSSHLRQTERLICQGFDLLLHPLAWTGTVYGFLLPFEDLTFVLTV